MMCTISVQYYIRNEQYIYIMNNNENYYQRLRSPVAGRRYTYEPLDLYTVDL